MFGNTLQKIKILIDMEFKLLRFSFLLILFNMLVIPCSFLLINILNGYTDYPYMLSGFIISSLMVTLLNTYTGRVTNIISVENLELYATWNVPNTILVYGIGLYYVLLTLPIITITILIFLLKGISIHIISFIVSLVLGVVFLISLSIFMGTSFTNPNIAQGINSYISYILLLATPLYYKNTFNNTVYDIIDYINPISHILRLLRSSLGIESDISILISISYIIVFCIIISIINQRRILNMYMVERYI